MTVPERPLTALVLAGGRALRLGGRKAERELGGQRLLDRVLAVAARVSDDVLLLPRDRMLEAPGVRIVADWPDLEGPLAGLGAGLDAARHEWCLLLPCDLPHASADVVRALVGRARRSAADALLLRTPSGVEPFHGLYRRSLNVGLRAHALGGGRSLLGWIEQLATEQVDVAALDPEGRCLQDVDTPEQLARARAGVPP